MIIFILQIIDFHFPAVYLLVEDGDTLIDLILHLLLLVSGYHLELILKSFQFLFIVRQLVLHLLSFLNHILHLAHQVVD